LQLFRNERDQYNKEKIRKHLYNDAIAEAAKYVNEITDEESFL
jgi:hypothetical protein